MSIADVSIANDNVWWMLFVYSNRIYIAIIVQLDVNGNLISSFSAISSISKARFINYYFASEFLKAYDDFLFIYGETSYSQNLMGISENSQFDATLMKIDSNQNIKWITSFDLNLMSERTSSLFLLDGVLYLSFHSDMLYLWICSISADNGSKINSSWLQTNKSENISGYGRFIILSVSQKNIIARDYSGNDRDMK